MNKLGLAVATVCLVLTSCGGDERAADQNATTTEAVPVESSAGGDTTVIAFPPGARIIEEGGVTFRIDPDGTRVRLGPTDSRIVVEDDVRFRVDPDGTRVRIDPSGAIIAVDDDDVSAKVRTGTNPAIEVDTRK